MSYQAQAVDATEPVSDSSWEISANLADYNVVSGCTITYDSGNMTLDVAAGVVTHNGSTVIVAAQVNAVTLVSDSSNPTFSWVGINSSGTVTLVTGTPAVDPAVPEQGDNVTLSLERISANETIANDVTHIVKRIPAPVVRLDAAVQGMVESGRASFVHVGHAPAAAYANGDIVSGISVVLTGTGTMNRALSTEMQGGMAMLVTTSGDDSGWIGNNRVSAAADWVMGCRIKQSSSASAQDFFMGLRSTTTDFADENTSLGWRLVDTGNFIGFTDDGGSETTRDTSNNDTSEHTLRLELSGGGATLKLFFDNAQVGADITTNISSSTSLALACGVTGGDAADHIFFMSDFYFFRGN